MFPVPVTEGVVYAVTFKTNYVNIMSGNIKTQFIICVESIYFMLKLLVCTKQLRVASLPVAFMLGELIYLVLFSEQCLNCLLNRVRSDKKNSFLKLCFIRKTSV